MNRREKVARQVGRRLNLPVTNRVRTLWMQKIRFPNGLQCPRCGSKNAYQPDNAGPDEFRCFGCHKPFSSKVNTWLHNRKLALSDLCVVCHVLSAKHHSIRPVSLRMLQRSMRRSSTEYQIRHARAMVYLVYDAWADIHPEFASEIPTEGPKTAEKWPLIDAEPEEIAAALFELRQ